MFQYCLFSCIIYGKFILALSVTYLFSAVNKRIASVCKREPFQRKAVLGQETIYRTYFTKYLNLMRPTTMFSLWECMELGSAHTIVKTVLSPTCLAMTILFY